MASDGPEIRTALITGGASGFGESYARQLAAQGIRLWLVDRQADRLAVLAAELTANFSAEVETLTVDLAQPPGQEAVAALIGSIDRLDLLVNAAGFGAPGLFHELPLATHLEMLNVHVTCVVRFCQAALPGMVARRNGAIVNISALAIYLHVAGNVMYGATKRFVDTFTRSLHEDVSGLGVSVQILVPGYTRTRFHATKYYPPQTVAAIPGILWMPVDALTRASLQQLPSGRLVCVTGWVHRFLYFVFRHGLFSYRFLRRRLV